MNEATTGEDTKIDGSGRFPHYFRGLPASNGAQQVGPAPALLMSWQKVALVTFHVPPSSTA